jgi:hypothetical protein
MNKKIDVCFLHAGSKLEEVVLNQLLSKTKKEINLIEGKIGESYADSMNELIKQGNGDYVVIFPSNLMVDENWLEELIRYYELIVNPGCVGIYDYLLMHKMKSGAVLDVNDKMTSIWTTDNFVEGVTLFSRSSISENLGLFEKAYDNTGYEQTHFSMKYALDGYNNFYIRCKSTCSLRMPERDELFASKTKEGAELINEFIKSNLQFLNK